MKSCRVVFVVMFCCGLPSSSSQACDDQKPIILKGNTDIAWSLSFSPDGGSLASGGRNYNPKTDSNEAYLWDLKTGKSQALRHGAWIFVTEFSPDGKTLVTTTVGNIRLWDPKTGRLMKTLPVKHGPTKLVFSADSQFFATASGITEDVEVWNLKTRKIVATLSGHSDPRGMAFGPDATTLAVASEKGTIRLWDVKNQKVTAKLEGHTLPVDALKFSQDGKELLSAGADKTIRRWVIATGKSEVLKLDHPAKLYSLAFSPNGKDLAYGDENGAVTLWDTQTGKKRATLGKHPKEVNALAFSADGKALASGGADERAGGVIMVWKIDPLADK
jgi:WD40 repeat protein